MVLKFNFKGAMTPVFTPFCKESGVINVDVIPKYADYIASSGINGVLVNGTAGEGTNLTIEERKVVLEFWMRAAKSKGITVMVQVGGRSLKDTIELAKHAESQGVDAILCLPDLFFRPKTVAELTEYLTFVGNAANKTPLFYYHIPFLTGVTLDMAEFLRYSHDKIETLSGIKFTSNNLQEGAECLTVKRDQLTVFLGNEQMLAGACVLGFDSCLIIGINLVPDVVLNIMDNVKCNNNQMALEYQYKLTEVMAQSSKYGLFPGTRATMSYVSGIEMGNPRAPLTSLNKEQLEQLKIDLMNINLLQ